MSRTDGEGSQPVSVYTGGQWVDLVELANRSESAQLFFGPPIDDLRAMWATAFASWALVPYYMVFWPVEMTNTISWRPLTYGAYQPASFYSTYGRLKGERLVRARAVLTRFYWGLQNGTAHNAMPTPGKARNMAAIKARVEKIDWEWDKEAFSRGVSGERGGPGFSRNLKPMQQAALVEQLEAALAWQPDKATTKKWAADDRRQLDIEGAMGPMEYVGYNGDYNI